MTSLLLVRVEGAARLNSQATKASSLNLTIILDGIVTQSTVEAINLSLGKLRESLISLKGSLPASLRYQDGCATRDALSSSLFRFT